MPDRICLCQCEQAKQGVCFLKQEVATSMFVTESDSQANKTLSDFTFL